MQVKIIVQDVYNKLFVAKRATVTFIKNDGSLSRSIKLEKGYGYDVKSKAISDAFKELGLEVEDCFNLEDFARKHNLILDYISTSSAKIECYFLRSREK